MYELLATAAVFPNCSATSLAASRIVRLAARPLVASPCSARDVAASTVACQVRKSFAEKSPPDVSLR